MVKFIEKLHKLFYNLFVWNDKKYTMINEIFDNRNEQKKSIHRYEREDFYINEREIWYIKLWINVGYEQNGKKEFRRPVVVLKKVWSLYMVLPLTSKLHHLNGNNKNFYHKLHSWKLWENKESAVILSQLRSVDKKRFMDQLGMISEQESNTIKEKTRELCL